MTKQRASKRKHKQTRESAVLPSGGTLVELTLVQLLGRLIGEGFLVFRSPPGQGWIREDLKIYIF